MLASRDGSIWTGGDGALTRVRENSVTCFRSGHELPGSQVTSLFEDHAGRLWVGIDHGLWVYDRGRFQPVTRRDARPIGLVTGITEDADQRMWIAAVGPPQVLMRVDGLSCARRSTSRRRRVALRRIQPADCGSGFSTAISRTFAMDRQSSTDSNIPKVRCRHQLLSVADGSVLAATTYGLIGWLNGKALTLTRKNGLPCEQVYAMAFDRRGDLWLGMNCALGVLRKADFQAWKQNPDLAVSIRTFDGLDGIQPIGWVI